MSTSGIDFNKSADERTPLLTIAPLPCIANNPTSDFNLDLRPRIRDWRIGLTLALTSGLLFTANNFLIQYYEVDPLEMLLVRSVIQSIVLGTVA